MPSRSSSPMPPARAGAADPVVIASRFGASGAGERLRLRQRQRVGRAHLDEGFEPPIGVHRQRDLMWLRRHHRVGVDLDHAAAGEPGGSQQPRRTGEVAAVDDHDHLGQRARRHRRRVGDPGSIRSPGRGGPGPGRCRLGRCQGRHEDRAVGHDRSQQRVELRGRSTHQTRRAGSVDAVVVLRVRQPLQDSSTRSGGPGRHRRRSPGHRDRGRTRAGRSEPAPSPASLTRTRAKPVNARATGSSGTVA